MSITIRREIGSGAFGSVYEAFDERLGRRVAVKIIRASAELVSTALDHARALARVNHQNVVSVYTMQGHILIMRPFPSLRLWTWGSSMLGVAQVVAHAMIRSVAVDRRVSAEACRGCDRGHRIGFRQRS
jgi:hypothetical protein